MEQAADTAEAAAVDHYCCARKTEKHLRYSLPVDTEKQTDDCFVMCPRSPSKGRNTNDCYCY